MVALDSINGSLRARDGSFTVSRNGHASCDGWAFDDQAKSTPADVWLELTNIESGARHYWHARRYSRPALASAVGIPSVAKAGLQVRFRRVSPHSARLYCAPLSVGCGRRQGGWTRTYTNPPKFKVS